MAQKSAVASDIHDEIDPLPAGMVNLEGRGDVSAAAVQPSKVILRCYGCCQFGNPAIMRCACKCTYFCSKECQKQSWMRHKKECVSIRAYNKSEQEEQRQKLDRAATIMRQEAAASSASSSANSNVFTCSVCLEDKNFDGESDTILLDCGHRFCFHCIEEVQRSAMSGGNFGFCPQCRQPLPQIEILVAERVYAMLALVKTIHDKQHRDEVCKIATQLLGFLLRQTPGRSTLQQVQGDVYHAMKKDEQAVICYKKAYNIHRRDCLKVLENPSGTLRSLDEYDKRIQEMRDLQSEEPATDFPLDMKDLELEIAPMFDTVEGTMEHLSCLFLKLAKASIRCAEEHEDKVNALRLALLVHKINKPLEAQYGGCRALDMDCTKVLAECYVALGKVEYAQKLTLKAIRKFRYHRGLHKIMAECEIKEGNLEKALFYLGKGYYYEEVWNEEGTRAQNSQLWNTIRLKILKQSGETK